jgi:hypothetical protein
MELDERSQKWSEANEMIAGFGPESHKAATGGVQCGQAD